MLAACAPTAPGAPGPGPAPAPAPATPAPPVPGGGAGGGALEAPPPEDDNIRFAEHIELIVDNNPIAVVNPFVPAGAGSSTILVYTMIYDRLLEWDRHTDTYHPGLATRWVTADYQTYTFYLRDDVYFHNGDKFTAQDVVNTIELARQAPGTGPADMWRPVETVRIINDHEIEFVLNSVNVYFMFDMAVPFAGIVNRRAIEANPDTGPWVGTGPYMIDGFLSGDFVEFVRNDNYWGEPAITRTQAWRFIPEVGTRTIMMQTGASHICNSIGPQDVPMFEADDNFNTFPLMFNGNNAIIFNLQDPVTGDMNFRMAVVHAIDREEISAFAGWAVPYTTGSVWGSAMHHLNDIPLPPRDLDLAKQYLAASPYNGEEIVLYTAIITNVRAAEVVQQQLGMIGIDISINGLDPASFQAATPATGHNVQLMIWSPRMTLSPSTLRFNWYPVGAHNRALFNDPAVTALIDLMPTVTDPAARVPLYMEFQERIAIAVNPSFVPLFNGGFTVVAAKGVGGMDLPADNQRVDLRYVYMILED
jgi:peptide/nickel transport system substrate-binding protein